MTHRKRTLFIGVRPSGLEENRALRTLISKMKRTLNQREVESRWIPPELWHMTLLFLGPVGDEREILEKFGQWSPPAEEFDMIIEGVGAFPEPRSGRVLWLGVRRTQALLNLQTHLEEHFQIEDREFVPHITLARFRNLNSLEDLVQLGGRKSMGAYPVSEVVLFESVLEGAMVKYVPLSRRPIKA